jgi:hypothetical protein
MKLAKGLFAWAVLGIGTATVIALAILAGV